MGVQLLYVLEDIDPIGERFAAFAKRCQGVVVSRDRDIRVLDGNDS
jgi:hypothetical protein